MKISRRTLAQLAVAGAVASQQALPQPPPSDDLLEQARKQVQTNSEALLKHEIAMTAEPSFQFKA